MRHELTNVGWTDLMGFDTATKKWLMPIRSDSSTYGDTFFLHDGDDNIIEVFINCKGVDLEEFVLGCMTIHEYPKRFHESLMNILTLVENNPRYSYQYNKGLTEHHQDSIKVQRAKFVKRQLREGTIKN